MTPQNPLEARLAEIPVRERAQSVLGSKAAIWEYGPEDARDTVVIVHGFRGTHHGLLSLVALMPEVRFICPDLPGFGASEPLKSEHSLDNYGAWLTELLSIEDPDHRSTVLGHSFGSMIVASAVRNQSGTVPQDVILVNPIAENALAGPSRILTNLAIFYYWLGTKLPQRLGHALLASPIITRVMSEVMATTRDRALRAWIHAQHEAHFSEFANRTVLLEAFRASVSSDVSADAGKFPRGTTLIAGTNDSLVPVPAAKRLQQRMPEAELHLIDGVGHLIHYETPKPLARLVRDHLERQHQSSAQTRSTS